MGNLKGRLKKLSRVRWAGSPPITFIVTFVNADDGRPISLTLEETSALEAYKKKMQSEAQTGKMVVIEWTREKAQELLAQRPEPWEID